MNWLSRHRYRIGGTLALVVLFFFLFGQGLIWDLRVYMVTPSADFDASAAPRAPDYSDPAWWAALPDRKDPADVSPNGLDLDAQDTAPADVFYVHPTTYISPKGWNQPLEDEAANAMLDNWVLTGQASAFNSCCRVYAPKYRQATIAAFVDKKGNGEKALALAYEDVTEAFDHYIRNFNQGRPILIAGHSQGAMHANRLIEEVASDELLANRLVAAYTIGRPIARGGRLPVCESETQTGCQISWNSQTADAGFVIGRPGSICVNPLNWTAGDTPAPASANKGSVDFSAGAELEIGIVDARCKDGRLLLTDVASGNFREMPFGPGNYHRYEFSLYYMNIRENAEMRVEAFLNR